MGRIFITLLLFSGLAIGVFFGCELESDPGTLPDLTVSSHRCDPGGGVVVFTVSNRGEETATSAKANVSFSGVNSETLQLGDVPANQDVVGVKASITRACKTNGCTYEIEVSNNSGEENSGDNKVSGTCRGSGADDSGGGGGGEPD